jgi:tRNA A-37 threonylcarbamoyl transferase component Bud32
MAIEAGRVLSERYRLIRPVGQGSQASVWVAEHLALTTHVAVKLIDPELAKKESARERFRREATAAAQLRSAHVVQILDHGIDDDQPFIVMELLDGEDLFERLAHRTRLSLRETSKIVTQVARALIRAHAAGIVHRDLKPENVFLCPNEDDEVVKVLDFGVAKVKDAAKVTMQKTGVGTLIGTPHYMSPEQVKGIGEVDSRADLWALGIIAFQCVTGELPYDSEGVGDLLIKITIGDAPIPSRIYPGAHPSFDAWFAKACARDPTKRFQTAREMAVALAGVVTAIDGVAPRAPTVRPPAASVPHLIGLAIPKAPRAATEALDASDWEEVDDTEEMAPPAPVAVKPQAASRAPQPVGNRALSGKPTTPVPAAPRPAAGMAPAPRAAAEPVDPQESHDIVDFDETVPVTEALKAEMYARAAPSGAPPAKALPPVSEPPPRSPAVRDSGPPLPLVNRVGGGGGLIAPVVMPPRRQAMAPPPGPEAVPPSIPRAPPPSQKSFASTPRPTPGPVVTPLENLSRGSMPTDPPPELDGSSKRRRLVRFMLAGLLIFVVGITWTVVRSQLDFSTGSPVPSGTTPTVTAPPPPPEPPRPTSTATAVDPGMKVNPRQGKPVPTVHRGPLRPRPPKPDDGTIVVPDPDAVPAAP